LIGTPFLSEPVPCLSLEMPTQFAIRINRNVERHLSRQGMGRTTVAWIKTTECHLHHIEDSLSRLVAGLDQSLRHLSGDHLDGSIVIGCPNDEIGAFANAVFIACVMVCQSAAHGFHYAHAFAGDALGTTRNLSLVISGSAQYRSSISTFWSISTNLAQWLAIRALQGFLRGF